MGARKVRTKSSGDKSLRAKCEKESGVPSTNPRWTDGEDTDRVYPDEDTTAIIIDMRDVVSSAVQIFTKDDEYIDMVGMDHKGYLVVVPWKSEWSYFCIGKCRVGYTKRM